MPGARHTVPGLMTRFFCSLPLPSGTPVTLGAEVKYFTLSPDTSFALYLDNAGTLYSVPATGGTPVTLGTKINSPYNYRTTPDSSFVVYRDVFDDLYSIPVSGGTPVKLAGNIYPSTNAFRITPDSSLVVAKQSSGQPPVHISGVVLNTGSFCISTTISIPVMGGTPVSIGDTCQTDTSITNISPDSSFMVARSSRGLYIAPTSGGEANIFYSGSSTQARGIEISPDSKWLAYSFFSFFNTRYYGLVIHYPVLYQIP
ncbi:MAG: hypothetical protein ACE5FU_04880 [Nitrospinota bacterium]